MTYKVLIIGLGQIGMLYDIHLSPSHIYTHARAFTQNPLFTLVAGVDSEQEKRDIFTLNYASPAYPDLYSALNIHTNFDVIVIATPTDYHAATLEQILSLCHPRLILCEKPLAYSPDEAQKMIAQCQAQRIGLFVNYMRRSEPGAITIKQKIVADNISQPIKGCAWYSKGFLHNGSHLFNLLEFWLGDFQNAIKINNGRTSPDRKDAEPDVVVTFKHGTIVFLAGWEEAFSHYTIELLSSTGRLRYELGGEQITWERTMSDPQFAGYTILSPQVEVIYSGMQQYQQHVVEQIANQLEQKSYQLCSGQEALTTLSNMYKIIYQ